MFSVTVPRANTVETALPDNRVSPADITVSIMVVEDEADVLDIMVQLLTLQGHRVYAGRSAAEVQQIHAEATVAGDAPVDMIIADYRLGDGATGLDAIEALCVHIGRSVPAIIVTGDTSPSRIKEATVSGHRILHKPITGEELHEAIIAACVRGGEPIESDTEAS
jgi:CheY-like chemotaxis protein